MKARSGYSMRWQGPSGPWSTMSIGQLTASSSAHSFYIYIYIYILIFGLSLGACIFVFVLDRP